jgi:RHS repeat-associated protein
LWFKGVPPDGSTIDGAAYTLDNAGNRTAKTDQRTAVATGYGYDNVYQLLSATQGAITTESYAYDAVGNRTSSLGVASYTTNSSNEMTANSNASFTYDSNGNQLTKVDSTGTTSYTWDFENRLASVTLPGSGGTVTFKYDPFGKRIYKSSSSSGTSVFAYDGDNVIEEVNYSGAVVARYIQDLDLDDPLGQSRSGTTSFYQADGLGSITSLSNGSGTLAESYAYDSFGALTATSGSLTNSFRYTGREFDSETGLYYYRTRYYDPALGRFSNEDPIQFSGGENFYRYVVNSPLNFTDPYGLIQVCCRPAQSVAGIACHCFILLSDGHTLGGYFKPPPFLHPKPDDDDDNIGKRRQPGTFCNKVPTSACDENRLRNAFGDLQPWMIYGVVGTSNSIPGDLLRTAKIPYTLPPCAWAAGRRLPHKSDPLPPKRRPMDER